MSRRDNNAAAGVGTHGGLVLAGGALTVVGAFLGWLTVSAFGRTGASSGIDMLDASPIFNGVVTVLAAVVAVVLTLAGGETQATKGLTVVAGAVIAGVAAVMILAPDVALGGGAGGQLAAAVTSPGIGVFATLLGGVLVLAGGAVTPTSTTRRQQFAR
jgi:hypothetical protein